MSLITDRKTYKLQREVQIIQYKYWIHVDVDKIFLPMSAKLVLGAEKNRGGLVWVLDLRGILRQQRRLMYLLRLLRLVHNHLRFYFMGSFFLSPVSSTLYRRTISSVTQRNFRHLLVVNSYS